MSTSIWSCNLIIGGDSNQVILERIAIKRLPISILMSDNHFINSLKLKIGKGERIKGEKIWDKLPKNKLTGLPTIKVFYLKQLGTVAQEPYTNSI